MKRLFDKNEDSAEVEMFINYISELRTKKKNDNGTWVLANEWAVAKPDSWFVDLFNKVKQTGLKFNPRHISISVTGLSFDYVAYKNRMLLIYPETKMDFGVVYKGDIFEFSKADGVISYRHELSNPFENDPKNIIGAYTVIKNKRGEFVTTISKAEIDKCKNVARTSSIWNQWYVEMTIKTVIKKAVKVHFDDVYVEMEKEDNKNYDLEKPTDEKKKPIDKQLKMFIELCEGVDGKEDLISMFEDSTVEERRKLYKQVKDQKNDNT